MKRQISVLVKNMKTRKQIKDAKTNLTKTPIYDVKKYLKEHGFLKIGSTAPNNVLREIYESIMMAGDVTNVNGSIDLFNYMAESEEL